MFNPLKTTLFHLYACIIGQKDGIVYSSPDTGLPRATKL